MRGKVLQRIGQVEQCLDPVPDQHGQADEQTDPTDGKPDNEGSNSFHDHLEVQVAGDQIGIEKGDGTRLNYAVVRKQELALEQTDMSQIMQAPMGEEWLNLITCSGNWIKDKTTFDKRTIVYSRRVL